MSIEQKINYQLNKIPGIKKYIKRIYQLGMYAISPKIKCEGDITCISPDDKEHEYFFGYYDKSPWDITDRYVLCLKAKDTWSDVSPKETADIILIDTKKDKDDPERIVKIAETRAWNVQQSCMLQWLGPDYSSNIIFNDFREDKYVSVIKNVKTGEERVIPAAIYTISNDGKTALTLDFSRLYNLRPGYGYYNVIEKTKDIALPDTTAIWSIDIEKGIVKPLLKYTDFATFQPRSEMQETGAIHKVNHLMLNPSGNRFMVLYRWFNGQRKYTRLITCNVDGSEMYLLSDDDMVSHCFWKDDTTILAFENKRETGPGYYLMQDKTQEYIHCWPQFSNDGHPSYSPNKKYIVTDSYPDRARIASIYLMDGNEKNKKSETIVRVFAPFKYDNDTRCDLHPRWNRESNMVCFDSVFEGHRGLYAVKIEQTSVKSEQDKINIAFVMTACKKSGPIEQMLSILTYMDRDTFNPVLITLYDEPEDGTSQLQRYLDIGIRHIKCPLGKKDIILGKTRALKDILSELNIHIVHSLGVFPDYALSRMKYPGHVITLRNYVFEDYPVKYGKIVGTIMAFMHLYAMKRTDQTWACSASLSQKYNEKLRMKYPYIQNGVNVSRFVKPSQEQKKAMREKLNLPVDKTILIYAGQFVARKDQRFLLELFAEERKMKEYVLLLLGEGANYSELKKQFNNIDNIIMTGSVNNVNEYLQASDIYISSSKSEGLPNGVLEAMAVGLPVILSDIEQHKEILLANNNVGVLYHLGDKKDCAEKVFNMNKENQLNCGEEAFNCAHNQFSAERMSQQYQNEYLRVYRKVYQK